MPPKAFPIKPLDPVKILSALTSDLQPLALVQAVPLAEVRESINTSCHTLI